MSAARRIYTFERDPYAVAGGMQRLVSACAVDALVAAIAGEPNIRYEELTVGSSHRPMIAAFFADAGLVEVFGDRLTESSRQHGVRVVQHIDG